MPLNRRQPGGGIAMSLLGNHISLMHGWVPITAQIVTPLTLAVAAGWRSRRWRLLWLPVAAVVGVGTALGARRCISAAAPDALYVWIALVGVAMAVLILGWRGARWWRRGLSILAVPLCLLCSLLVLNQWIGYFQTAQSAWDQFTSVPLPNQADKATVTTLAAKGSKPPHGSLVPVVIPTTRRISRTERNWSTCRRHGSPATRPHSCRR
jgi:hypothetical protein